MKEFSTVKNGSTGTDVYILQSILRMLQYRGKDGKPIDINGVCTENTVYAINTFQETQRAYGYECGTDGHNDGMFGSKCWSALFGYDKESK